MATSGTTDFAPTFDQILEDAAAMVGGGPILASELDAARRGMDLLLTEIQNKNILLHKIESTVVAASVSVSSISLPGTILDVHNVMVRTSAGGPEIAAKRRSFQSWAEQINKSRTGRPTQYWLDRQQNGNTIYLWPVPSSNYELVVTVQKLPYDTSRAFQNVDVPRRFLPALTYGLAYWVGLRRPKVPLERINMLKALYEDALKGAMREDRERASFRIRA